jgi:hypothetical protein
MVSKNGESGGERKLMTLPEAAEHLWIGQRTAYD